MKIIKNILGEIFSQLYTHGFRKDTLKYVSYRFWELLQFLWMWLGIGLTAYWGVKLMWAILNHFLIIKVR